MTDDELLDAYLSTRIHFVTGEGDIVETVPEDFPGGLEVTMAEAFGLDVSEVWCVSAENPRSQEVSDADNIARNQALDELLREMKLPFLYGFGEAPDGSYSESTTLVGLRDDANIARHRDALIVIARQFEQNAVFRFIGFTQELVPVVNNLFIGRVGYRLRIKRLLRSSSFD